LRAPSTGRCEGGLSPYRTSQTAESRLFEVPFIAGPDGVVWMHRGGASGLGTSGSGDVLAGLIAGFAARGCDALTAALWGVFVHAAAGRQLARRIGPVGFLARELGLEVPGILDRLARR
ncbi:hypothetical protein XarjCFBP8253_01905, partial [Xanthomonas arboricola pv. juglandis]|uniref:NAD(P)H-hydrate dehydratase n=1 Tax=Xanthomonas arboricola TaxID=56448 RepID=UPI000D41178A